MRSSAHAPPPRREPELARLFDPAADLAARAPVPARLGRVRAGTAGWTDPTLIKSRLFYPRGVSTPESRLRFYATQFSMVEVDASYYALPSVRHVQQWLARTPDDFVFDIKAFAALTGHPVEPARLPTDLHDALPAALRRRTRVYPDDLPGEVTFAIWQRFKTALAPLHEAGRLGCVLLQFPPWFTATRANVKTLEVCRARLGGLPAAVEFRHASWGEPERLARVLDVLRANALSFVSVDEPQGHTNSMPPIAAVADSRLAVVRFHGRGLRWDTPGVSVTEKFDYRYAPQELAPWVPKVQRLAEQSNAVHLVFNNCVSNHAVIGAKDVMAMLAQAPSAQAV